MRLQYGQRFGRLLILHPVYLDNRERVLCICDCGKPKIIREDAIKHGSTKSCGCLSIETKTKHGHNKRKGSDQRTGTYISWRAMVSRCNQPKDKDYPRYGGVGITVCTEWLDFRNFLRDMGERPSGKTIDRRDGQKGYEPLNCRWATPKEQAANRRNDETLRKQISEKLKLYYDNPKNLQKHKETMKRVMNKPEVRAKLSESHLSSRRTP